MNVCRTARFNYTKVFYTLKRSNHIRLTLFSIAVKFCKSVEFQILFLDMLLPIFALVGSQVQTRTRSDQFCLDISSDCNELSTLDSKAKPRLFYDQHHVFYFIFTILKALRFNIITNYLFIDKPRFI